jgi:hypothetical protein
MALYRSTTDECPKCEGLESVFILVQVRFVGISCFLFIYLFTLVIYFLYSLLLVNFSLFSTRKKWKDILFAANADTKLLQSSLSSGILDLHFRVVAVVL